MSEQEQTEAQEPTPDETPAETPQETPAEPDETPNEPQAEPEPDEPQEPAEPAQEPPAPQSPTPEALEKRSRSGEQRFARYAKGIDELYADTEVNLLPCPLCPDQHKGFVDLNFAGRIPEEVADNVKAYLGLARPIDYRPSKRYRTCPDCDGEGKVDTGSHVAEARFVVCEDCEGWGYVPPPNKQKQNGVTGPTTLTPAQLEAVGQPQEDTDNWGEPRLLPDGRMNPNFGKMPQFKTLVEPWGVTANLTALDAVS